MTPIGPAIRLQGAKGKGKRCRATSIPAGGRKPGKNRLRKRHKKGTQL